MNQLISQEDFTSVQKAQAGISKLFKKASKKGRFYRVMRNQEPLGVLIPNKVWDALLEDLEALSSPSYLRQITKSRTEKTFVKDKEIEKELGIK